MENTQKHKARTSARVEMEYPIIVEETEIHFLELRRPKVRDMLAAQGGNNAESELLLVARLSGQNPEDLHQMDFADWKKVQGVLQGFLGVEEEEEK